jgi:hypothetical protein
VPLRVAAIVAMAAAVAAGLSGCWYYSAPPGTTVAANCTTKSYGFLIFRTYTTTCEPTVAPTPSAGNPPPGP